MAGVRALHSHCRDPGFRAKGRVRPLAESPRATTRYHSLSTLSELGHLASRIVAAAPRFMVNQLLNMGEGNENLIRVISEKISRDDLKLVAAERFGDLVKAVVDVEKGIMAIGGDLHADEEALLLEQGSKQNDLWGINLYSDSAFPDIVEFDSMINLRPSQGNRSRGVDDENVRKLILKIIQKLVE